MRSRRQPGTRHALFAGAGLNCCKDSKGAGDNQKNAGPLPETAHLQRCLGTADVREDVPNAW
jgi:hypothetical protein